jgi:hypothetical protein
MVSTRSSPGHRGERDLGLAAGDRAALRCDLAGQLAGCAGQDVVVAELCSGLTTAVLQLEPGGADAVDVGPTDHAATGVPSREHAPVLGIDVDADHTQPADLVADRRVDLAPDVDEPALLGHQFVAAGAARPRRARGST